MRFGQNTDHGHTVVVQIYPIMPICRQRGNRFIKNIVIPAVAGMTGARMWEYCGVFYFKLSEAVRANVSTRSFISSPL